MTILQVGNCRFAQKLSTTTSTHTLWNSRNVILTMNYLHHFPDCSTIWVTTCISNLGKVRRVLSSPKHNGIYVSLCVCIKELQFPPADTMFNQLPYAQSPGLDTITAHQLCRSEITPLTGSTPGYSGNIYLHHVNTVFFMRT